jgi:hypothetical protein
MLPRFPLLKHIKHTCEGLSAILGFERATIDLAGKTSFSEAQIYSIENKSVLL